MKKERTSFWCGVEYKYLPGSDQFRKFKGGFVYCFVGATDVRDAIRKVESEFDSRNLGVVKIEFVSPYIEISWDSDEEQKVYDELARVSLETNKVEFDAFYAFEDD